MYKILFLFLLPTFAHSQTVIQFCNVRPEPSIEITYLGKSGTDSIFGLRVAQALQNMVAQHTGDIGNLKATKADVSVTDGLKVTKADITYVNAAIAAIEIPPTAGIPQPINITTSTTISAPYNTDIWCKSTATITITLTAQPAGWHYRVHNLGTGTVAFKGVTGVTLVNSVSQGRGTRPLDISYQTTNTVEIH